MSASHMKRLAMPRSWPLPRKEEVWISRPRPCGHPLEHCMAVGVVLRDVLGLAANIREAKRALNTNLVKVDGRIVNDIRRGVGLMDVLSVEDNHFRCILDGNGKLRYLPIDAKAAATKMCRVENKTTIKGGKTQYTLHDGRNILGDDASVWATGDTLVIKVEDQSVVSHHKFEDGAMAYLIGGNHVGSTAKVDSYSVKRSSKDNEVNFGDFGTIEKHVFVISDEGALPEVSA